MYCNHQNPYVVAWNWSFFPIDMLFALCGLYGRFGQMAAARRQMLSLLSLCLMFCAGLMAISFCGIRQEFDPFWWGINIWLMVLAGWGLAPSLFISDDGLV